MDNLWIECIGLTAGTLGLCSWIPQLQTVWVRREHRGLDMRMLLMILAALILWGVYGTLRDAWAVVISNCCSGTLVMCIILRVRALRTRQFLHTQVPVGEPLDPNDPSKGTFVPVKDHPSTPGDMKIR